MNIMDKLLEQANLSYEDLSEAEKSTLYGWMDSLKKNEVTVASVRDHISTMKTIVEKEITTTSNNSKQDIFLKARLRNYLLLEDFLTSPERAEKAIEQAISGIGKKGLNVN